MTNQEIRIRLEAMAEAKYKEFSQSLIPGSRPILGVRIPALRNLAKELAKSDWKTYLDNAVDDSFEEVNLQGFVIGYAKSDYQTLLPYIKKYVAKINDWSLCDGFCATLKITKKYKAEFKELLKEYACKDTEFDQRFVAIMLMDYYLEDEDIDETLAMLDAIKHDSYYRKMGVAWAVATAMAKQREKTLEYMQPGNNTLDDWTYNKSIQKMIESYRISDEDKVMLRQMRR
ncbi:MAG: DNA alkylation repair protein [Lachnospiraceae bacterium]|nr:DNA alkylation repair protein [Lachnospiraceae bacterium]